MAGFMHARSISSALTSAKLFQSLTSLVRRGIKQTTPCILIIRRYTDRLFLYGTLIAHKISIAILNAKSLERLRLTCRSPRVCCAPVHVTTASHALGRPISLQAPVLFVYTVRKYTLYAVHRPLNED
jgi:hypothetical protein